MKPVLRVTNLTPRSCISSNSHKDCKLSLKLKTIVFLSLAPVLEFLLFVFILNFNCNFHKSSVNTNRKSVAQYVYSQKCFLRRSILKKQLEMATFSFRPTRPPSICLMTRQMYFYYYWEQKRFDYCFVMPLLKINFFYCLNVAEEETVKENFSALLLLLNSKFV